jgi:hypothetical protein
LRLFLPFAFAQEGQNTVGFSANGDRSEEEPMFERFDGATIAYFSQRQD